MACMPTALTISSTAYITCSLKHLALQSAPRECIFFQRAVDRTLRCDLPALGEPTCSCKACTRADKQGISMNGSRPYMSCAMRRSMAESHWGIITSSHGRFL